MCSGRVDLEFILRAFANGQDGVFIGGCRLNECNYVTQGNYDALGNTYLAKKIMKHVGLNPDRLRIEFMSSSDGILFAEVMNDFSKKTKALGLLGQSEGVSLETLKFRLDAVRKLVPYIRLVERERLRAPVKSEEAYAKFFASDEMGRLFTELIADKLAVSQIVALLREKPATTGIIAEALGLSASEVARHIKSSSKQGLVRYDEGQKCYMPA